MKTHLGPLLATCIATAVLASPSAADLKIGVLIPDSGPAGLFGPSARQAAMLAVEEINETGGIAGEPVEAVFADVGGAPAQAVQSAIRLWRGTGVVGFVGMHDSAVREALIGQLRGKLPYVYTPVYEGGECAAGVWVTGETPAQQLGPVIPWLAENEGATRWYLIGNDYVWGRGTNAAAREIIEAAGGAVAGEEYVPLGTSDYDASLQRIRASGANAVLVSLVGGDSVSFNMAYGAFGLSSQALRLGTLIEENTLAGIGAAGTDRLFAALGYFATLDSPAAAGFLERQRAMFGDKAAQMNTLGESTYDGLMLFAALARQANSVAVADMSAAAKDIRFTSPRGESSLGGNHVARTIYLADAADGAFQVKAQFDNVDPGVTCP